MSMENRRNFLEEPEQMDKYARNGRLYETLKNMGLSVHPICLDNNPDRIDHFVVSAGCPDVEATTLVWAKKALKSQEEDAQFLADFEKQHAAS